MRFLPIGPVYQITLGKCLQVLANRPINCVTLSLSKKMTAAKKISIESLDDSKPHSRWTAALALARLLGSKARPYLEHRAEDAGDPLERCGMYAAIIRRAGDHEKTQALHHALQQAGYLS